MKKNFLLLISIALLFAATIAPNDLSAQINVKTLTVQSSNAVSDTILFNRVVSRVNGFQVTVQKKTGTIAGKIYFEGSLDGIGWARIDSITLADAAINTKVFPVQKSVGTSYLNYRFNTALTGTQTSTIKATYIRRTDE